MFLLIIYIALLKTRQKMPFCRCVKSLNLQAQCVLLFPASQERYSRAKEDVDNDQECGKTPLPGEDKRSIWVSSI